MADDDFNKTVLAALATLQQGLYGVQQGQDNLQRGHTTLAAQLLSVRTDIMERIDRLQDELGATKDDVTVNAGAADRLWRAIASDRDTIEGLREVITLLQRKVTRLEDERGPGR